MGSNTNLNRSLNISIPVVRHPDVGIKLLNRGIASDPPGRCLIHIEIWVQLCLAWRERVKTGLCTNTARRCSNLTAIFTDSDPLLIDLLYLVMAFFIRIVGTSSTDRANLLLGYL